MRSWEKINEYQELWECESVYSNISRLCDVDIMSYDNAGISLDNPPRRISYFTGE